MRQRIAVLGAIVAFPVGIAAISQALADAPGEPDVPARVQVGGDGTPSGGDGVRPVPSASSPAPNSSTTPGGKGGTSAPGSSRPTVVPPPPPVYDDGDDGPQGDDDGEDDG